MKQSNFLGITNQLTRPGRKCGFFSPTFINLCFRYSPIDLQTSVFSIFILIRAQQTRWPGQVEITDYSDIVDFFSNFYKSVFSMFIYGFTNIRVIENTDL